VETATGWRRASLAGAQGREGVTRVRSLTYPGLRPLWGGLATGSDGDGRASGRSLVVAPCSGGAGAGVTRVSSLTYPGLRPLRGGLRSTKAVRRSCAALGPAPARPGAAAAPGAGHAFCQTAGRGPGGALWRGPEGRQANFGQAKSFARRGLGGSFALREAVCPTLEAGRTRCAHLHAHGVIVRQGGCRSGRLALGPFGRARGERAACSRAQPAPAAAGTTAVPSELRQTTLGTHCAQRCALRVTSGVTP